MKASVHVSAHHNVRALMRETRHHTANKSGNLQKCASIFGKRRSHYLEGHSGLRVKSSRSPLTFLSYIKVLISYTSADALLFFCFSLVSGGFLYSRTSVCIDHFGTKLSLVLKDVWSRFLDYYERVCLAFLLSDQMLVTKALYQGTSLLFFPFLFFQTSHPACCKLTGLNRILFEVLCEHKSLLIKVPLQWKRPK